MTIGAMSNMQHIENKQNIGRYFALIPHIADDDLDPYQYRLYGHYIRICAISGSCTEGTRETAKATKMSVGKVSGARKELAELGYIELFPLPNSLLGIVIRDRVAENVMRCQETECSGNEHQQEESVQAVNTPPPQTPPIVITIDKDSKGKGGSFNTREVLKDGENGVSPSQSAFAWYDDSLGEPNQRVYDSETERVDPETDLELLVVAECNAKYLTGAMLDRLNKPMKIYDPRVNDFIAQSPNELYEGRAYQDWIRRKVIQVVSRRANKWGVIARSNFIDAITNTTGFSAFLKTYKEPEPIPQDINVDW